LAAHAHVSTRQLARVMKTFAALHRRLYRTSAHGQGTRFVARLRDTIKTVAAQVGYADVHHFTASFAAISPWLQASSARAIMARAQSSMKKATWCRSQF
jgi:AraC-like DNA-binding protein